MRILASVALGALALLALGGVFEQAWGQDARPTCSTFNAQNEPSSSFEAGERIIVRGTGFGQRSLVFVRFEQGARTAELTRSTANDLGAFTTSGAVIPDPVEDGPASIEALDARGSATCDITVAQGEGDGSDLSGLYLIWGSALAVFAVVLGVLTYRRWKAERLNEAMNRLSHGEPEDAPVVGDEPAYLNAWELDPWEEEAASARRPSPENGLPRDEDPLDEDESGDVAWFDPEADEASVKDPTLRNDYDSEWVLDDADHTADVAEPDVPPVVRPVEPPSRPGRPASEAIERLRREVKTWGRP